MNLVFKSGFIYGGTLPLKHMSRRFWLDPTLASHLIPECVDHPLPTPRF